MISTTTSSSPIQLNPVAPTTNSTATSTATPDVDAAPDAALSGFQLLLGAVQQLQQNLPTNGTAADAAAPKNSDAASDDSGNVLPLLGMILPQAVPGETAKIETTDTAKSKSKKDQDADIAATDLMSPTVAIPPVPAGFVIQSRSGGTTTAAVQSDAVTSALTGVDAALAAQSGVVKDADADLANNKAIAAMPKGGTNSLDAVSGVDVSATTGAAVVGKEMQGLSNNPSESDFDALVKHFDASNQTSLPAMNIGDSSGAHQASRTYASAASAATTAVPVPVGSDGWSDAVADKVMWFSANKISSAEIHLNPPDLGPLQVRVSTQHDQMSVVFTSQHAAVRDALDQALPRLRDMMGSQGMHSLDVSVGGQSAQQQQQQQQSNRNDATDRGPAFGGFFADNSEDTAAVNVTTINTARLLRSGVDAYA